MCVLLESNAGDKIIIIENFVASRSGTNTDPVNFTVGQQVKFCKIVAHPNNKQLWMVEFLHLELLYKAMHTCFVTIDTWENISTFFRCALKKDENLALFKYEKILSSFRGYQK